MSSERERVAIVGGVRSPFVKAGTVFSQASLQDLGVHVLKSAVKRFDLKPETINQFVFGAVLLDPRTPNWAREILFAAGLPKSIYAYSVSNNCISGLVSLTAAANEIALGRVSCAIAGGVESMSNPSLLFTPKASQKFFKLFRSRSLGDRLKVGTSFRPKDFFPQPPGITEPSTGLTMGQHMEITAQAMNIARADQDEIAYLSHKNAHAATVDGRLPSEIEAFLGVSNDTLIRADTSIEKLKKLPPVFDRSGKGALTAGNSSPLTDGASCVVLMSETRAKKEGRKILAFIKDYEYAAIDPNDGLLMAPALAVPRMLKRNSMNLGNMDLVEIHEAFAAQVLANIQAWEKGWKGNEAGSFERAKLNSLGGSIAIGHPFAATGGRIITTLSGELSRKGARYGLASICAAGAMAGAVLLERAE